MARECQTCGMVSKTFFPPQGNYRRKAAIGFAGMDKAGNLNQHLPVRGAIFRALKG